MHRKIVFSVIFCLLVLPLSGCQTSPQTTEPPPTVSETPIPLSAIPTSTIIPTESPVPPTATQMPSETPIPPTLTITAQPEHRVTSIDELVGVWRGKLDTYYLQEYTSDGQTRTIYEQYPETVERELFTFEDGLFTWGDITFTIGEPQECLDDPVATYEVYITYRDDQPESLRWVLVGEEHCEPRYQYLTIKPLTWYGATLP